MGESKRRHTLGNKPVERVFEAKMRAVASTIDGFFNSDINKREVGFVLMVFPLDAGPGRCNYMSNCDREDVIILLKEQLAYFQGQPEIEGKA